MDDKTYIPQSLGEACYIARTNSGFHSIYEADKQLSEIDKLGDLNNKETTGKLSELYEQCELNAQNDIDPRKQKWSAKKIQSIERNQKKDVSISELYTLAKLYRSPELARFYCNHYCDYGRKLPLRNTEVSSIMDALFEAMDELHDIEENLFEILEDNTVSPEEQEYLKEIEGTLLKTGKAVAAVLQWAEKNGIKIPKFKAPATGCNEKLQTLFYQERKRRDLKQKEAAQKLWMDVKKLRQVEYGEIEPNLDELKRMCEVYHAPELRAYFCSAQCPINESTHLPVEANQLGTISARLLTSLHHLNDTKNRLKTVFADQQVTEDEKAEFTQLLIKLQSLKYSVKSLVIWVKKHDNQE